MEQYLKKMAVIDRNKNSITLSNGSIIEIPFEIEDDVSIEELNKILKEYLDKLNILDEEELYRFSDDALYEAKARGKYQVVLFEKE